MARNFADILDVLLTTPAPADPGEDAEDGEGTGASGAASVDYLAVADELYSGRISVAAGSAEAEYLSSSVPDLDIASAFDEIATAALEERRDPPLPVDPASIARELSLDTVAGADLPRLRRSFALANHPDRVPQHLRGRAERRMQIANMLIDARMRR